MNSNSTSHTYVHGSYTGGCLVCDRHITHPAHRPQTTLVDDLVAACVDALHTLENTSTDEPDWARGTIALLREALARAERER